MINKEPLTNMCVASAIPCICFGNRIYDLAKLNHKII